MSKGSFFNSPYEIKAKRTRYNGILFKSRTEARWAVFMDLMGIEYKYEPESQIVGGDHWSIGYCPDFFLSRQEIVIEVKGAESLIDREARAKAAGWVHQFSAVFFLCGIPNEGGKKIYWANDDYRIPSATCHDCVWQECLRCGNTALTEFGEYLPCGCYSQQEEDGMYTGDFPEIDFAKTSRLKKALRMAKDFSFIRDTPKVSMLQAELRLY